MLSHTGNVFVLSAPSGTGKSTLAKQLVREVRGLDFSISFTTRQPRPGEVHGVDYFYIDDATFDRMVAEDGFVEWVQVYNHRYGTGKAWIQDQLATGRDVLLDIETQGAARVHEAIPDAVMIYLLPPSAQSLADRLRTRGKDSEEQIRIRLGHARHELEAYPEYDYLVINDSLEEAYRGLESILLATRLRRDRMGAAARRILEGF